MSEPEINEYPPEQEQPEAKPKKKGRSKLLVIGIPLFVLLGGGGAGAWWYFNQPAAPGQKVEEEAEPGIVSLESFVANLADTASRKYLRAGVVLLVKDEAAAAALEGNKLAMSRVRAAVLEALTMRTSNDIATPEGRAALKKTIAETASRAGHLEVRDVLFEEFIIQ